jgi:hypothetical protein
MDPDRTPLSGSNVVDEALDHLASRPDAMVVLASPTPPEATERFRDVVKVAAERGMQIKVVWSRRMLEHPNGGRLLVLTSHDRREGLRRTWPTRPGGPA